MTATLSRLLLVLLAGAELSLSLYPATAQDSNDVHATLHGAIYKDDKIRVRIPADWNATIESVTSDSSTYTRGAILRQGNYVLYLCTLCGQVSGIAGGRFNEISLMVQPWFRVDPGANGAPCGKAQMTRASALLDRTDFWFQRDPTHVYDEDADDCREPKTTAVVWYGSYFAQHCPADAVDPCGGFFLDHASLTHARETNGLDQMVFAMMYDTSDLDQLPHRDDPQLARVLREATAIVKSVQLRKLPSAKP